MERVSLVFVSHSADIVKGIKSLLFEMQPEISIAVAGGEEDGGIGTNAMDIQQALESVYTDKGTVVLFDLGSALLNAELAIEMIGEDRRILIADAPILEGGYAAVVEAGFGSEAERVVEAAEKARSMRKIPQD
ncbi:dihydroxyacetone kinase phosphoryl donor subunit DhaM [Alkalicoccus halolimnae]|uniref:phosphoenolpyruvate--glycerone phosphotransferase n=1 Tax=Alkalicoccus halolimnae TaxID=1667239 RepID=A0A5C7F957_9BACI|nr:dihydroxyacetone kinase phosphoryl donor subunit DhaM [Alkalicoccus halolimnae]TXF85908.1 PTS-dependent dihydroxyacetone kinase phosphotransferase subunit DhaM [Alkalicoccus halolimnae]